MASMEEVSQINANGCAECPDCHEKIKVGTAGIQNMHKTHWNSQNCRNTQAIAKKQREKKRLKNGTLDGCLCPRPAFIALTVQPIPLIRILPVLGECTSTALPSAVVFWVQREQITQLSYPANKWAANQNG
ncbi:hypothetical protein L208DRAFT_1396639 [Tricholoma matsutake]|nr:hypothetical protein L208DRAFT_1396639 [Tricholoma matsutake 945]